MLSPQPNYTPQAGTDHRQRLLDRLRQLAELEDDWDGEGKLWASMSTGKYEERETVQGYKHLQFFQKRDS